MLIRPGEPDDAVNLAQIHHRARAQALPTLPIVNTPEEDAIFFSQIMPAENDIFVIESDGAVKAFAASRDGWLNHLYVQPEDWRRGFGRALLEHVRRDLDTLQLWTFQDNARARAFYRRCEFIEVEFTDGAYNEEKTPDVRCVWTRKP